MAPTSARKSRQFSFTLSEKQHRLLFKLAEMDNRSAANWLRDQIRRCYADCHPAENLLLTE